MRKDARIGEMQEAIPVPEGLPARFSAPEDGFKKLCGFLEIANRSKQQAIVKTDGVWAAVRQVSVGRLSSAPRLRKQLMSFYSLPGERRQLWQHTLTSRSAVDVPGHPVPSFEYQALKCYDSEFLDREMDEESLRDASADFPGASDLVGDAPEWQQPALAIWPNLRRDVLRWKKLLPPRQEAVVVALFAVATILDDRRFLHWAGDRVGVLAEEFEFARASDVENAERSAMAPVSDARPPKKQATETKASGRDEANPAGEMPGANVSDVIQKWKQTCAAIAECASALGGDPLRPERLPELREHVRILEQLHDPVVEFLEANRLENLMTTVEDTVTKLAGQYDAPWLVADQIHAQWKLIYLTAGGASAEQLREDVERVILELKTAVDRWNEVERVRRDYQEKLRDLEEGSYGPGDVLKIDARRVELQEEISRTTVDASNARRAVFRVVAPRGQDFDPSRNYKQQLDDTGVFTHEPPVSENTVQEPAEHAVIEKIPAASGDDQQCATASVVPSETVDESVEETSDPDEEGPVPSPMLDPTPSVVNGTATGAVAADDVDAVATVEESGKSGASDSRDAPIVAVLWRAVKDGRPGIGYHIAKLLTERGAANIAMPPADLIAASMLADHVQSADGEVVNRLRFFLERINPDNLSRNDWRYQDAVNLLLFSATLRPALFAPATGAPSLLRRVNTSNALASVYDLAKAVANHGDRLQGIGLDTLSATLGGSWRDEFETLAASVDDWSHKAKSRTILFQRATRVWQHLLSGDGCLAKLVVLISRDDENAKDEVEAIRKQVSDRNAFNDLVRDADRSHQKNNPIHGRALRQLWDSAQPIIDLSDKWLRLMSAKPDSGNFVGRRIQALRRDLLHLGDKAISAIEHSVADETLVARVAALKQAHDRVIALRRIFSDDTPRHSIAKIHPDVVLSQDLLYVVRLDLNADYRPADRYDTASMLSILADDGAHAESLRVAFHARLKRGDLVGAQLASKGMDEEDGLDAEECRTLLEQATKRECSDLRKTLVAKEEQLENAFCRGQLGGDERNDMAARLAEMKRVVQPVPSTRSPLAVDAIARAKAALVEVEQSLSESSAERIERAKNRLDLVLSSNPEGGDRSPVDRAIESRDILTANELMDRLEEGEAVDLPASVPVDPFEEFLAVVEGIDSAGGKPGDMVRAAAASKRTAGVSFEGLLEDQAAHAARLLEAWYTLSRKRRVDERALEELLQRLGFKVRRIVTIRRGWSRADLEAETIEDRTLCPLRQFGSEAGGRYRILFNWESAADESVFRSIGIEADVPTMVLHFGRLGAHRESLRKLGISNHRLFLVIDESLVLFLAARPSERLAALFRCTLPFSSAEPYATTSGVVPPELFYGREYERRSVTDRFGACFIYGGRQLGKTALLRRVERDFNRRGAAHVAKWIDLKVNEIGYARGPRDIWRLLQRELSRGDVVSRREIDPENRRQVDSLCNQMRQWLDERKERRLLLLLDEADAFLEQDAKADFSESARLKGLMEETDRRFKVVFAGLHNVLRTTRQTNHPLAHFGDPIRVGAMLSNGEWRAAQELVREPLQAVGCRFARDELSTRILAQTNYYPSLIQVYGAELVRRLRDSKKTFPYEIGDEDIDATYGSPELRSAIRERFLITLQLDQRYEVIAYALAFELDEGADLGRGLEPGEIEHAAKAWWPEGFEMTDVEFSMLLHEMEGLGVLRSTREGRYTLRNPNILLLLGSRDDVASALNRQRALPAVYEPASYRARYRDDQPSSMRHGPLTYQQETRLRTGGVTVVSGCKAAGMNDLEAFLVQRIGPELFRRLPSVVGRVEFERELKKVRPVRNNVTVCLVPMEVDWDTSWLTAATKGRTTGRRVVFMATPEKLWRILAEVGESDVGDADWIASRPWDKTFLRVWLENANLPAGVDHVDKLMDVSGGWPIVLEKFSKRRTRKALEARINELNSELLKTNAVSLSDFGVYADDVERVLRGLSQADDPFDHDSIELVSSDLDLDSARVLRQVRWGERLGLISRAGDGCWTFNPLVKRLLAVASA